MLDNLDIAGILRRALAGGGEFADIYFEEGSSTAVVCEDGKIEKVLAGTDRGVGVRVISDLRTAYAYSNEVTQAALLALEHLQGLALGADRREALLGER